MKVQLCLLAACLVLPLAQVKAGDDDKVDFAGSWNGTWKNSLGEQGNLSMKLSEDSDGRFTGKWGDVNVRGKRSNANTLELTGKNSTRSYQFTATIRNGKMRMKYEVTRLDSDGSYDGECTLTAE